MSQFATAINCVDGRVQLSVINHLRETYKVDYVDTITAPGANKLLADGLYLTIIEFLKRSVDISVNRHGSRLIAIVGHHDCAGNPADSQTQQQHIRKAMKTLNAWGLKVSVIGLWVNEQGEVSEVTDEAFGATHHSR